MSLATPLVRASLVSSPFFFYTGPCVPSRLPLEASIALTKGDALERFGRGDIVIDYNQWFLLTHAALLTAGESHGESLVASLSGVPAGLNIDQAFLDRELWRASKALAGAGE